jgi:hypothetical protein
MGTQFQVLEIIFEMQRKMNNEKITRRKISFPNHETFFFSRPFLFSNLITILFLIHFK